MRSDVNICLLISIFIINDFRCISLYFDTICVLMCKLHSFSVDMSIVDGQPLWSLNASETGESTKCPWVGMVEDTAGKNHPLIPTLFTSPPLTNPNLNSDCCHMPHLS